MLAALLPSAWYDCPVQSLLVHRHTVDAWCLGVTGVDIIFDDLWHPRVIEVNGTRAISSRLAVVSALAVNVRSN